MAGYWVGLALRTNPGVDPAEVEINVILEHFRGTGWRAMQYKRLDGIKSESVKRFGFYIYKVRIEKERL